MKAYADVAAMGAPDLLARAQSGEREAFAELVERHHQELVRIAYAITGDIDSARDAGQTAWIKAWQRLPHVREPERLRSWLIAIVANEARQRIRADRRRRVREIVPLTAVEDGMSATTLSSAERLDLAAVLGHLSPNDRQLLAMRYLAGLTADEIGQALGMSASGVRTRLSRLMAQLREELGND
jgi:RNA polymerase sigma-70 factor (ECF subfamily)